jgi:hypothetical protein
MTPYCALLKRHGNEFLPVIFHEWTPPKSFTLYLNNGKFDFPVRGAITYFAAVYSQL